MNTSTIIKYFIFMNKSSAQLGHIQCSLKSIKLFIFARWIVPWFSATFNKLFSLNSLEWHPFMSTENLPYNLSSFLNWLFTFLILVFFLVIDVEIWTIDNLNHNVSVKTEKWSCKRANLASNCAEKQDKRRLSLII